MTQVFMYFLIIRTPRLIKTNYMGLTSFFHSRLLMISTILQEANLKVLFSINVCIIM